MNQACALVALSREAEGLNPHAVVVAIEMGAKAVWCPSFDAPVMVDEEYCKRAPQYFGRCYNVLKPEETILIVKNGMVLDTRYGIVNQ